VLVLALAIEKNKSGWGLIVVYCERIEWPGVLTANYFRFRIPTRVRGLALRRVQQF
jgi:hypothetical protein